MPIIMYTLENGYWNIIGEKVVTAKLHRYVGPKQLMQFGGGDAA